MPKTTKPRQRRQYTDQEKWDALDRLLSVSVDCPEFDSREELTDFIYGYMMRCFCDGLKGLEVRAATGETQQ